MSWQERIERYKRTLDNIATTEEAKNQGILRRLLDFLSGLQPEEMLIGIRDELWKMGEIGKSTSANRETNGFTTYTAEVSLAACWKEFRSEYYEHGIWGREDETYYHPPSIKWIEEELAIKASFWSKGFEESDLIDIEVAGMNRKAFSLRRRNLNLERSIANLQCYLVQDCIERQNGHEQRRPPYTKQQSVANLIIQEKRKEGILRS